uniref:Thioredoxin h-like protein n=1 Tax=Arundo donax TaxID=35708 RepID=A0A0A9F086_ARUDO
MQKTTQMQIHNEKERTNTIMVHVDG